jgi:hypothetical protein
MVTCNLNKGPDIKKNACSFNLLQELKSGSDHPEIAEFYGLSQ